MGKRNLKKHHKSKSRMDYAAIRDDHKLLARKQPDQLSIQIILAEYEALRSEVDARIQNQQQLFLISITFLGIVLAVYNFIISGVVIDPVLASALSPIGIIVYKAATPEIRWFTYAFCIIFNGLFGLCILNTKGNTAIAIYISDRLAPHIHELMKDNDDFNFLGWRDFRKTQKSTGLSHFQYLILYTSYFVVSYFPSFFLMLMTIIGLFRYFTDVKFTTWDWIVWLLILFQFITLTIIGVKAIGDKDFVVKIKDNIRSFFLLVFRNFIRINRKI